MSNPLNTAATMIGRLIFVSACLLVALTGGNYLLNPSIAAMSAFIGALLMLGVVAMVAYSTLKIKAFWQQGRSA